MDWHGDEILERIRRAAEAEIMDTMVRAVQHTKQNHGGWENRTGRAERSIRIIEPARRVGSVVRGVWGGMGVVYLRRLEFEHGSALRNAAAATYAGIAERLRGRLR